MTGRRPGIVITPTHTKHHARTPARNTALPRDQKRPQPVLDQKRVFAKTVKTTFQKVVRPEGP